MPVLVKRWRSVVIWVKSFSVGESGNLTELAPEVLNSKALQSRTSQAAITSRCTAVLLASIIGEQRSETPWFRNNSNTALFALRRTATAAPCHFKPDLGSTPVLLPDADYQAAR